MSATKKTYPLLHLSCAGCAAKVEQNLNKYPGVSKAAVNFASSVLSLEFDAEAVSPADLRHKVQELGYDLLIETTSQNQTPRRSALGKALGALLLSIPVFVISMFYPELPGAHYWLWALSTPVVLWFGRNFFIRSFKQVRRFSADMDSLVALSTGVAYVFSVIQTFFPAFIRNRIVGYGLLRSSQHGYCHCFTGQIPRRTGQRQECFCHQAVDGLAGKNSHATQGRRFQPRNPSQ